jgi:hypothetical protein
MLYAYIKIITTDNVRYPEKRRQRKGKHLTTRIKLVNPDHVKKTDVVQDLQKNEMIVEKVSGLINGVR